MDTSLIQDGWHLKPDYEVPFDTLAIRAGRDPQLEKALSLIR